MTHTEAQRNRPKTATHYTVLGGYVKKVAGIWYLYSPFTDEWLCLNTDKMEGLTEL